MRLSVVGLLFLLVLDVGIVAAVFTSVGPSTPDASGESSRRVSDDEVSSEESDEPMQVAVFGDAFAAGGGADSEEGSWVSLLAEDEGWTVDNLAEQQKAYGSFGKPICDSDPCDSLLSREEIAAIGSPDLILVSGGRAFLEQPPSREQVRAIKSFFRKLSKSFPESDVAATNPLWGATTPPSTLARVTAKIDTSVSKVGGTFLDVGQPLVGKPELLDQDTGRPTDEGQESIAQAVALAMSESALAS